MKGDASSGDFNCSITACVRFAPAINVYEKKAQTKDDHLLVYSLNVGKTQVREAESSLNFRLQEA